MKKKQKRILEVIGHYFALGIVSVFVLLPYYWMIVTAIKPTQEDDLAADTASFQNRSV